MTTVNGQDVTISIMDGTVMIDGTATVTVADLEAGNGVVHSSTVLFASLAVQTP